MDTEHRVVQIKKGDDLPMLTPQTAEESKQPVRHLMWLAGTCVLKVLFLFVPVGVLIVIGFYLMTVMSLLLGD